VKRQPAEPAPAALVVTRIVQYACLPGYETQLEEILLKSLVGKVQLEWGTMTAAVVDDLSPRQQDILGLLGRQPGVWEARKIRPLDGNQPGPSPLQRAIDDAKAGRPRVSVPPTPARETPAWFREEVEAAMTDRIVPDTGPTFSVLDQQLAKALVSLCGLQVAYTIAVALQSMEGVTDDDPKLLKSQECYALANAIIQLIPDEYLQETPPPAPSTPNPAAEAERQVARDRVAAIQAGSIPVPTFKEQP
jgi:hypothetical protein